MKTTLLLIVSALAVNAAAAGASGSMPMTAQKELVTQYCSGCHNDKVKAGGFSWARIDLAHPDQNAAQTEKVIRKLRAGMMPPAGAPRPDAAAENAFASALETAIDRGAAARPYAGAPALHRLNRTEYRNSIRDLLGVDVDVTRLLPPDDMSHGFDNMADALTITPALMDGYIRAASKISREALGDDHAAPAMTMYNVPKVVNQMRHVEGTPLGTRGGVAAVHNFPADGEYKFRVTLYYSYLEELIGQTVSPNLKDQQVEISVDGARVGIFTIDPKETETKANFSTPPVKVTAGPHQVAAAFIQKADGPVEDQFRNVEQTLVDISAQVPGLTILPHLRTLSITGPYDATGVSDTPSRTRILTCHPSAGQDEVACARQILTRLGRKAYRRPVTDSDVELLLTYYQAGRNQGNFETGIRNAIQAMITHPEFLVRFEKNPSNVPAGENYRISDPELASRLSYFLWSSSPDEELIELASQGKLANKETLEEQVRRMLADPRSQALSDNFAFEWLHLQNVKEADPDGTIFPNYTRNLSSSMTRETQLLFDSIVREDRNVLDLLTANYTFVDEVLAKHYGIPEVYGNNFRRVTLTDPNRFGILGQGSFLMLTSLANRTSPVQRGKYVMEVLLGVPPPVPPPNVPPLKENVVNEKQQSVRERLEMHRQNEPCASCHKMMDPIGLSLENFDAVGTWRVNDSDVRIDPSSQMFDGTRLDGPVSLRNAILNHSESYLRNFAENLMAYGAGRVLDYRDLPAVRAVAHQASMDNNRFSAFVSGIVNSTPFQMRRAEGASATSNLQADSSRNRNTATNMARR